MFFCLSGTIIQLLPSINQHPFADWKIRRQLFCIRTTGLGLLFMADRLVFHDVMILYTARFLPESFASYRH